MKSKTIAYLLLFISSLSINCFSQSIIQKTITGTVIDQHNALLTGAVVTLYIEATQIGVDTTEQGKFTITFTVPGIDENKTQPNSFFLYQNFPNPFNPTTLIRFSLNIDQHITLNIYNILGEKIKTLVDENLSKGIYSIQWGGDNDNGVNVSAGIYFYRITGKDKSITKKMILEDGGSGKSSDVQPFTPLIPIGIANNYHLIISGKDLLTEKYITVDLSTDSIDVGTISVNIKPQ